MVIVGRLVYVQKSQRICPDGYHKGEWEWRVKISKHRCRSNEKKFLYIQFRSMPMKERWTNSDIQLVKFFFLLGSFQWQSNFSYWIFWCQLFSLVVIRVCSSVNDGLMYSLYWVRDKYSNDFQTHIVIVVQLRVLAFFPGILRQYPNS